MRTETATVLAFPGQREARRAVPARARVRLEPTRRGRRLLTVVAFLLGLLVAAVVLLTVDLPSALAGTEGEEPVTITVESGDTLWGFAEQYAPDGMGAQEFVDEVRTHNHLTTPRVTAGQQLELPGAEDLAR